MIDEFLGEHWGDLGQHQFEVSAIKYFGGVENFVGACILLEKAFTNDEMTKNANATLVLAIIKAAYDLGRESATQ